MIKSLMIPYLNNNIAYPFTFIHVSFISNQNLVHIVRSMLFNVANPVPNVWYRGNNMQKNTIKKVELCGCKFMQSIVILIVDKLKKNQ